MAHRYWRLGENSPAVGAALGIKPPLVRAMCWRMRKVAGELGYGARHEIKRGKRKPEASNWRGRKEFHHGWGGRRYVAKRNRTQLIPKDDRLPLVIKMHAQGYATNEIRCALGWRADKKDGYGMVKRLMAQAGLR